MAHVKATKVWGDFKDNLDKQSEKYRIQCTKEAEKEAKNIIKSAHKEAASIIAKAKGRAKQAIEILNSKN